MTAAPLSRHLLRVRDLIDRALTKAGKSLVYREPEGLGIYRSLAGETRLYMGFGSRSSMTNANRYANLFYKNVLVD